MDFIVGLPRTQRQHNAVFVVVDRLTKMAHFIPTTKKVSATQVADLFIQHIFRIHGLPETIVSDRDTRFTGQFWTSLFTKLGTKLKFSSGEHPETDGQTERVNQVLEDMLRAYVSIRQKDWENYLPLLEFAYNSRKHSATKFSPFELNYGVQPLAPYSIGISCPNPCASQLLKDMRDMLDMAKRNIRSAVDRVMHYANQKRTPRTFEVGDLVYLLISPRIGSAVKPPKLSPRYCGPWKIIKKIGKVAYKLEFPMGSRIHPVFHVSRLKKCLLHEENIVDGLVALQSPPEVDNGPDRILDVREKKLRNHSFRQVLVSWKGHPLTDATWESVSKFRKAFPDFIIEDDDQLLKGDGMS
jgi:hypothetical protein